MYFYTKSEIQNNFLVNDIIMTVMMPALEPEPANPPNFCRHPTARLAETSPSMALLQHSEVGVRGG